MQYMIHVSSPRPMAASPLPASAFHGFHGVGKRWRKVMESGSAEITHRSTYVFQWFNGEVLMSFSSFRDVTWCNYWKHKKCYFLIKEFWLEFQLSEGRFTDIPLVGISTGSLNPMESPWSCRSAKDAVKMLWSRKYLLVLSMSLIIFDLRPVELWQSCQSWKPDDRAGRFDDWAARFCFDDRQMPWRAKAPAPSEHNLWHEQRGNCNFGVRLNSLNPI